MAFVCVSGEVDCRAEEVARATAERAGFQLVTESQLCEALRAEFPARELPDKAWPFLGRAIVAKAGLQHHLVITSDRAERIVDGLPNALRTQIVAPIDRRLGPRKKRMGSAVNRAFDLILNADSLSVAQMTDLLESAIRSKGLDRAGLLAPSEEAQVQFEVRLKLAAYGVALPDRPDKKRAAFGHPSEEVFANLLDFYRIQWDYEPRSFPLQWDKDGKVSEAFAPDFYLPEFDLYVELTTMKQANVTRKNRKIRLLRAIYPHVNIQVFYQKDVQDLVMKYGLPERLAR